MDMTASIAPKSDQLNADDLTVGPRTFKIEKVTKGSDEQPFNFHLEGLPGHPYRPSKTMRRVMVKVWGPDSDNYVGRSLTLYCDPAVKFGREAVGGIKISHVSHIEKAVTGRYTESQGRKAPHTVEPLPDVAPAQLEPTADDVAAATDREQLGTMWRQANPEVRVLIEARVNELDA